MQTKDIASEQDLTLLIRHFYDKLQKDELIAKHFLELDLEHHIPRVVAFWAQILLDIPGYNANVFEKHLHLDLDMEQTKRWVKLFTESVEELFIGEKAEMAIQRASSIGYIFGKKFEEIKKQKKNS